MVLLGSTLAGVKDLTFYAEVGAEVGIEKETPIEDDVGGGQLPILLGQFFPQAWHDVGLSDLNPPMQFNPEVGPFQFGLV